MCNTSKLVDDLTLLKVKSLAPQPTEFPPTLARDLVTVLDRWSVPTINSHVGLDDKHYYEMLLTEIHEEMIADVTEKRLGLLCRAIGLTLVRKAPGFVVCWNGEQIKILEDYFCMEVES